MATGDVLAGRIASATRDNAYIFETDLDGLATGGAYTLGTKIVLDVASPGYDATGTPTTIHRTVYATFPERKAYSSQATFDESTVSTTLTVRLALSDFIYAGDTVTATVGGGFYTAGGTPNNARSSFSVTNNSTLTHPSCIGRWAWPGGTIESTTFILEADVFHRSAWAGKPVAAVVFTVTDGTTTKTGTATAMILSPRSGASGCGKVLTWAQQFDAADFIQGAKLTCNFKAYPWVGDSGATLDSNNGITPPDERLCPLELVANKTGAYGEPAAVVDPTNGHNSTASTWVAASQGAAETAYTTSTANSYTTMANAVQALKAYNNTNNGRNNAGGGIVLLTTNTHAWSTNLGDQGAQDAWTAITRLSTKTRSQCVIASGSNVGLGVRKVRLLDVTLSGSSVGQINGGGTTLPVLWGDQCTINMTGTAPFYQWRLLQFTRCDVTALPNGTGGGFRTFSTDVSPRALIRGNAFTQTSAGPGLEAEAYCVLGNLNIVPAIVQGTSAQPSDNGIYAFNKVFYLNQSACVFPPGWAISVGFAFVQNVIEKITATDTLLSIAADGCSAATNNVLIWHNTFAGERYNGGYNDSGGPFLHKNWSVIGNIFDGYNNKDDVFGANAAYTGSWPVGHGVGHRGNHKRSTNNNTGNSYDSWFGEFAGLRGVNGGALGFVTNASNNHNSSGGSGTGGGDYHLVPSGSGGTGAALALLDSAVLPFDLDGTARVLTNGDAGAFESQASATASLTIPRRGQRGLILRGARRR